MRGTLLAIKAATEEDTDKILRGTLLAINAATEDAACSVLDCVAALFIDAEEDDDTELVRAISFRINAVAVDDAALVAAMLRTIKALAVAFADLIAFANIVLVGVAVDAALHVW